MNNTETSKTFEQTDSYFILLKISIQKSECSEDHLKVFPDRVLVSEPVREHLPIHQGRPLSYRLDCIAIFTKSFQFSESWHNKLSFLFVFCRPQPIDPHYSEEP